MLECSKIIGSLDKLQDELLSQIATADMLDKSDKAQLQNWLKEASEIHDLSINTISLGKGNRSKFQNYLSS